MFRGFVGGFESNKYGFFLHTRQTDAYVFDDAFVMVDVDGSKGVRALRAFGAAGQVAERQVIKRRALERAEAAGLRPPTSIEDVVRRGDATVVRLDDVRSAVVRTTGAGGGRLVVQLADGTVRRWYAPNDLGVLGLALGHRLQDLRRHVLLAKCASPLASALLVASLLVGAKVLIEQEEARLARGTPAVQAPGPQVPTGLLLGPAALVPSTSGIKEACRSATPHGTLIVYEPGRLADLGFTVRPMANAAILVREVSYRDRDSTAQATATVDVDGVRAQTSIPDLDTRYYRGDVPDGGLADRELVESMLGRRLDLTGGDPVALVVTADSKRADLDLGVTVRSAQRAAPERFSVDLRSCVVRVG